YSGKPVLANVSFTVPKGQVVALLGRNGVGKTTLMRLMNGLTAASQGRIEILGHDPATDVVELRQRLGYLGEECHIYPWMTGEDARYFMAPLYRTWDNAYFHELVKQLQVPLNQKLQDLSKGSRRKLHLALTLAHRPEVILLDEPLSGLDPVVRDQVISTLIHTLTEEGRTILLSTHEIADIETICDRVLLLKEQRLALDMERDAIAASVRRVTIRLENPAAIVPKHPDILAVTARGCEMELIVRKYSDTALSEMLANLKVVDRQVSGTSLKQLFITLTEQQEEVV
ncbi:MAG TPA: ABC transporter ATP-binding protein, partial [Candidatus Ozemobacteraceae bacterium]|nr:ABC transporter ATP-binding protein [Candidatus Ozemobacteraceae bacterium]